MMYDSTAIPAGPAMSDILAYGGHCQPNEWTTETRAQYSSFAVAPKVAPPLPAQHYFTSMPAAPMPEFYLAQAAPAPPAPQQVATAAADVAVAAPTAPAAVAADASAVFDAAPAAAAKAARGRAQRPASARRAASISPKRERPPFHTYGRANVKPVVGGFLYGDYLATHNANVGSDLPLTRRPAAADMGGAQVHYAESDMRRSAHYVPPRGAARPAPSAAAPPPAEAPGSIAPPPPAVEAMPTPMPAPPAPVPAPAPAPVPVPVPAPTAALPSAPDYYAALPAYDASAYSSPPLAQAPISLPYYPMPLSMLAAEPAPAPAAPAPAPAPAAAWPFAPPISAWAAAPAAPPPPPFGPPALLTPPPGLVAFVPDAIGERLDPRRFKFAPRSVMAAVPPAGRRCVRRDNLGP